MTLFEKHLCLQFLKNTTLFLISFLTLFILIDYASHPDKFLSNGQFVFQIAAECFKRLPSLAPFALMLATIKTVSHSSQNLELVGYMASGKSLRNALSPLLFLTFLWTLLIYTDLEWGTPQAFLYQDTLKPSKEEMQTLALKDGSFFLFQTFLREKNLFQKGFWIQSIDRVIYTEEVTTGGLASNVKLFERDEKGQIRLTSSLEKETLPIPFKKNLKETLMPPEELPLSALFKKRKSFPLTEKQLILNASYYHKMTFPWLSFLAVLGPLPFSVLFKRDASLFPLYAIALFATTTTLVFFEAGFILSKKQMIDPFFVTTVPLLFLGTLFTFNFLRCDGSF
jgi:lipopolysaccharide export LptBFGC system permease protein LptF